METGSTGVVQRALRLFLGKDLVSLTSQVHGLDRHLGKDTQRIPFFFLPLSTNLFFVCSVPLSEKKGIGPLGVQVGLDHSTKGAVSSF